ncbi:hypothetical protein IAT40_005646 [Kwoniella sp. CBS 6097]
MLFGQIALALVSVLALQFAARPIIKERDEYLEECGRVLKQATRQQIIRKADDELALFARSPFPLPLPNAEPEPQPAPSAARRRIIFTRKPDPELEPVPEFENASMEDLA